ncbi:RdRP-domain-containing protein [Hypoxylon sp. NC1633]|nr:RdRP-domain-containing protein [Hypoxylon sp. NC1633]
MDVSKKEGPAPDQQPSQPLLNNNTDRPNEGNKVPPVGGLHQSAPNRPNTQRPTTKTSKHGRGQKQGYNSSGVRPLWADWDHIYLRLAGLPPSTTTFDVWVNFRDYGEITQVDLFEDRNGRLEGAGRIQFSPPPARQFWNDVMTINIQGQQAKVKVELQKTRPLPQVLAASGRTYPPSMSLKMNEIRFGVLARENAMMPLRTIQYGSNSDSSLTANLRYKNLEIEFSCDIKDPRRENPRLRHPSPIGQMEGTQEYKAHIPFAHLKKIVFIDIDKDEWAVLIPLTSPPVFFTKKDYATSHSNARNSWNFRDAWNRTVDITYDTSWFKDDPVSLPRVNQFIDIGRWTTYRLTFPRSSLSRWALMKDALRDFNIEVVDTAAKEFPTVPPQMSSIWGILEPQESGTKESNINLSLLSSNEEIHLTYDVRYQLESCISQGFLNEVDITAEFLQRLAELSRTRTHRRDRAKDILSYISQPRIVTRAEDREKLDHKRIYEPMSIFQDKKAMSHYPEISIPEHCQWVRKVVVTPTTLYLGSPAPEPSNRVLRHYAAHEDRFLRVQFTDEVTKGRIYPSPDTSQENALFNRVHRTLQNGIRIGGRHFQYLATGNSQFRENGAYFFCPTDFLTCDNIRSWMGDVNHIRVVAKYAARLGQCFSTTKVPKSSPIGQAVVQIQDLEHNGWCFTDGVGKIAPSRAKFLIQDGDKSKAVGAIPSVFQFRLGGSKGILVQWPDVPFNEVHLRPSQNKFNAVSKRLEVIKTSRYSVATLNRQTIAILSCLGVPDEVFEDMLRKQVANYEQAMEDPQVAMKLLSKFVDQNGVTTTMAQLIADGFMATKEPFIETILQVWRAWSMRLLREKARIVVDQGALVFGCVDETHTLRGHFESLTEGNSNLLPQVFLQVPKTGTNPGEKVEYIVITGTCVVGRNPSLHPGDIRVVEAVDVPKLRHLRDVVVFPGVGDRDIPSMCSGGDLDGDDYFVIWDPQLIPSERNYAPMLHDTVKPPELNRNVKITDMISFFVRYMKNDTLSTIAHAHLAKSDALPDGPKDPQCIELAQLHSNAVDYPKTGQEAHLRPALRPKRFPHFMERPARKSYQSTRILGRLYDQVAKVEFRPKLDGAFDERILRRYALGREMLKTVRMIKRQHDKGMRQIMNQYDIETEFEAWSTFVLSKPRVGSEYKRQETMEPVMANHRERFRRACIKLAGSGDAAVLYRVVAATYHVTWEEVQIAHPTRDYMTTRDEMPFISFPWIFEHELGRIATSKERFELQTLPQPSAALLDDDEKGDEDEFERLVGAGVIDGKDRADDDSGGLQVQQWNWMKSMTKVGKAKEKERVEDAQDEVVDSKEAKEAKEEMIELQEEEEKEETEETNVDALAKLTV